MENEGDDQVKELIQTTQREMLGLRVVDDASFLKVGGFLIMIASRMKKIEELRRPDIKRAQDLHKSLVASLKRELEPFEEWDKLFRVQMSRYKMEQDALTRIQQEKANAELIRIAEEDKKRAVEEAEAFGDDVEKVKSEPVIAPVVILPPSTPKAEGISTRTVWKFRIIDETKVPRDFMIIDESKLKKYATTMKDGAKVDGVEFYSEQELSVRSK